MDIKRAAASVWLVASSFALLLGADVLVITAVNYWNTASPLWAALFGGAGFMLAVWAADRLLHPFYEESGTKVAIVGRGNEELVPHPRPVPSEEELSELG